MLYIPKHQKLLFSHSTMAARLTSSVLAFAFLFSLALATSFDENEIIEFSYTGGSKGPDKWGSLSPHFSACSTGKSQSPVNIVKADAVVNKDLKPLTRKYQPTKAVLINNGFNIGMRFDGNVGVLSVSGKNYSLKHMYWHTPSEHQLDGVQYPAELQLVHIADDGSLLGVSILYKYGDSDPIVSKINGSLEKLAKEVCAGHEEAQIRVGSLDTKLLKRNTRKYYRYIGSLTTPPCSENVIWNILGKVRTISKEQVAALKAPLDLPYKNNSRPVQPLNRRRVQIYNELDN